MTRIHTLFRRPVWRVLFGPALLSGCLLIAAVAFSGCNRSAKEAGASGTNPENEAAGPVPVDYAGLDFEKLEEIQKREWQIALKATVDEASVHYAWAGLMTNLLTVRQEMEHQAKRLADADILNISTITNASQRKTQEQFIARRMLANDYGSAIHEWVQAMDTLSGRYTHELSKWQVSPRRASEEIKLLSNILHDQIHSFPVNDHMATERKICEAESEIARQYNYVVNSMESYCIYRAADAQNARLANPTQPGQATVQALPWQTQQRQNPISTDAREKFEEGVARIEKLKQASQLLRQPSNAAVPRPVETATARK